MADLTFGGTDIHDVTGIYLELIGGFDGVAEVRGTDIVIPGRPGMTPLSRVAHRRLIDLRGWVTGSGAGFSGGSTAAETEREDYRANIVIFQALFAPTDAAKSLVVTAPYLGLASGSKTISARFLNAIWGDPIGDVFRPVSVQLEAVGNPPDWA